MIGGYPLATRAIATLALADIQALPSASTVLLADRYAQRIHTIEVAPLDPVTFAPVPLWWADRAFTSRPDDTPANQTFQGRVNQAFTFAQRLPPTLVVGTDARRSAGAVSVFIGDGALDAYLDHVWEGQPIVVKVGVPGIPYRDFATLFTGLIQAKPEADRNEMTLRLRDPSELLDRPILTATYAGTGGLEGPEELTDTLKPQMWGHFTGAPVVLLDAANLIYQVSSLSLLGIDAVRDKGVPLDLATFGASLPAIVDPYNSAASQWDFNALGKVRFNLAQGTFQLGGKPEGIVTVDGRGRATGSPTSLLRAMLEELAPTMPLDVVSFSRDPTTMLAYAVLTDATTWAALWPRLLASQGSVLVPDAFGRMGIVTLRLGQTPTATISEDRIEQDGIRALTMPNPAWRLRIQFQHNWTPQDENATAGALDLEEKARLARPYLESELKDETLKEHFPLAEDPEPLIAYVTGLEVAHQQRLFDLLRVPRRLYRVPLIGRPFTMRLGQPIALPASRPLAHEKTGAILTIDEDAQTNLVTLDVLV